MIERNPAGATALDDLPTVAAISIAAVMTGPVIHEAFGHGLTCLALGGHVTQLSSVYFDCTPSSRLVAAMGPSLQFCAVALFLGLAKAARGVAAPRMFVFLILAAAFNGLWASGYFVYSGLLDVGDWAVVFRQTMPASWLWRVPSVLMGAWLYVWLLGLLARRLTALFAQDSPADGARIQRFIAIAYVSAGLASLLAVVGARTGIARTLIEAAQESFLAGAGLIAVPRLMARYPAPNVSGQLAIERSWLWIALAGLAFVIFALTLGRGI